MAPTTIPRSLVAEALGVDEESLPGGDLPLDRFARRFLGYLRETLAGTAYDAHPDFWTFMLLDALIETNPDLCLDALVACLGQCETPEDAALIAAGPLDDLIARQGPALIDRIEALAAAAPRLRYALSGIEPQSQRTNPAWPRLAALAETGPQIDGGDPLPPPGGLA